MTAPLAFDPDGRPPIELARLYRERSGSGTPTGSGAAGSPSDLVIVPFVATGSAPVTLAITDGADPAPECHPVADLTGVTSLTLVGSIGTTDGAAGDALRVDYRPLDDAAAPWLPVDGTGAAILPVDAAGDIIGVGVPVDPDAQRPVWLRLVGAVPA